MAKDLFSFFRGSAPSFHRLWSHLRADGLAPVGWAGGDPHWENLGSYRAKNRIAYFDFTDFDHCCLAPLDFDLGRALTGFYLTQNASLASIYLSAYRDALLSGKPQHIEREVAKGQISGLLEGVRRRRRKRFLSDWTQGNHIRCIKNETFSLKGRERRRAIRAFRGWSSAGKHPKFFRVLDIAGSVAGLGTLGLRRYLVLVAGGQRPHLIDMKEAAPSAVAEYVGDRQPKWLCEAQRVATIQHYVQYVPIAHLGWTKALGTSFVLSDLQPQEDRIDWLALKEKERSEFAKTMGKLLAWAHLRTASWKQATGIDGLMEYASRLRPIRARALLRAAGAAGQVYAKAFGEFQSLVLESKKT